MFFTILHIYLLLFDHYLVSDVFFPASSCGKLNNSILPTEGARVSQSDREVIQISRQLSFSLFLAVFRISSSFTPCSQHGSRQE